jgi:hypothetical protein
MFILSLTLVNSIQALGIVPVGPGNKDNRIVQNQTQELLLQQTSYSNPIIHGPQWLPGGHIFQEP